MNKEALINWLKAQQPKLEKILVRSAEDYYQTTSQHRNFSYCTRESCRELWLLGKGQDLCYDRPTIGFSYSLWYHPRRINTFLKYFTDLIYDSRHEGNIEIFDLGAGTGAVLWAVGLIVQGLKTLHLPCPKIKVINVDTSAFMISYNYHYLWKNFVQEYPAAKDLASDKDYQINSWTNVANEAFTNIWICASYLFDHSDNAAEIAGDFKVLIESYKPHKIILLSSSHKSKYCDAVGAEVMKLKFRPYHQTVTGAIFSGPLQDLLALRQRISQQHGLDLQGVPTWNIDSLYGTVLINQAPQLSLGFNSVRLFVQPEKDRSQIKMSLQQRNAAEVYNQPTLITGPAGCGKSVVLTQKVKNILEATRINNEYNPNLKILLTTFNRELIKSLGDWVEQLLTPNTFIRTYDNNGQSDHSYIQFKNSAQTNIYILHFDVLPTKIGKIQWYDITKNNINSELFHYNRMQEAVNNYLLKHHLPAKGLEKILDPDFLLDEYQRIIYGYECNRQSEYQMLERTGRGRSPKLEHNSKRRRIIWGIIYLYLETLKKDKLESFIIRRHKFLKKLRAEGFPRKFSHILVDEFQDCTKADYEIFYQLLQTPNHLTLAGDIAQSIHLGASLHIPRSDDPQMKNISRKNLSGSFRLPFRVSECIKPLSLVIRTKFGTREGFEPGVLSPYRGAPPGSRPILVYAENAGAAAAKITEVYDAFKKSLLRGHKVTIYERDAELLKALEQLGTPAEMEIILRTKGLEKHCVVWSTRTTIDTKNEQEEFIYTILTRTVSLLIILFFPETPFIHLNIVKKLVPDRLMRWDQDTDKKYQEIMNIDQQEAPEEDVDTSGEDNEDSNDTLDTLIA